MAKNIGATLTLKDNKFFANIKSATSALGSLKGEFNSTNKSASSFSDKLGKVSSSVSTLVKGVTVAGGAAATAVGAMVAQSVSAFSDYQQLTGGIETLFKDSADVVKNYANEAYANAGLSANEYMDTVTSFSAALISSMSGDTEAAAAKANTALEDMSDNANKMGNSMDTVMQTYQSLSRGTYTMLDNLRLGYSGSKTELERLLSDAEKYRAELGQPVDYDISSFADIVSAIHDVQEQMGITGTTAKEAATTVQGSAKMLKAAWKNALTAVGTGENFKTSVDNLVSSATTFGKNIIPAIRTSLSGVGQLVQELAPVIAAELPGLVSSVLPDLVSAAGSLISGVASQIPTLAKAAWQTLPSIFDGLSDILGDSTVENLKTAAESIGNAISSVFSSVSDSGVLDAIQTLANAALPALCSAITVAANAISFMANNWETLLAVALPIVTALGLYKAAVIACNVATAAVTVVTKAAAAGQWLLNSAFLASPVGWIVLGVAAVVTAFVVLWNKCEGFRNFWINLWNILKSAVSAAWNGIKSFFGGIGEWFSEKFSAVKSAVSNAWDGIKSGASAVWDGVSGAASTALDSAKSVVTDKLNNIKTAYAEHGGGLKGAAYAAMEGVKGYYTAGYDFINNLTGGKLGQAVETVKSKFTSIVNAVKDKLSGIKTAFDTVKNGISTMFEGVKTIVTGAFQFIVGIFTPNVQTIQTAIETVKTGFTTVFEGVKTYVLGVWTAITSGATLAFENIKTVVTNVIDGIKNIITSIETTFTNIFDSVKTTVSNIFDSIKTTISDVWDGIKSLIKTPHIVKNGTISIAGIDTPIPKLGIEWYAKGGILKTPTVFGFNGNNAMVGGESGSEAILPLSQLWQQIGAFADKITGAYRAQAATTTNNIYITVDGRNADDAVLAEKIAQKLNDIIENM